MNPLGTEQFRKQIVDTLLSNPQEFANYEQRNNVTLPTTREGLMQFFDQKYESAVLERAKVGQNQYDPGKVYAELSDTGYNQNQIALSMHRMGFGTQDIANTVSRATALNKIENYGGINNAITDPNVSLKTFKQAGYDVKPIQEAREIQQMIKPYEVTQPKYGEFGGDTEVVGYNISQLVRDRIDDDATFKDIENDLTKAFIDQNLSNSDQEAKLKDLVNNALNGVDFWDLTDNQKMEWFRSHTGLEKIPGHKMTSWDELDPQEHLEILRMWDSAYNSNTDFLSDYVVGMAKTLSRQIMGGVRSAGDQLKNQEKQWLLNDYISSGDIEGLQEKGYFISDDVGDKKSMSNKRQYWSGIPAEDRQSGIVRTINITDDETGDTVKLYTWRDDPDEKAFQQEGTAVGVSLLPVAGTAVFWNDMSTGMKIFSVATDVVALTGFKAAKPLKALNETGIEPYVKSLRNQMNDTVSKLEASKGISPEVIDTYKTAANTQIEYVQSLATIDDLETLRIQRLKNNLPVDDIDAKLQAANINSEMIAKLTDDNGKAYADILDTISTAEDLKVGQLDRQLKNLADTTTQSYDDIKIIDLNNKTITQLDTEIKQLESLYKQTGDDIVNKRLQFMKTVRAEKQLTGFSGSGSDTTGPITKQIHDLDQYIKQRQIFGATDAELEPFMRLLDDLERKRTKLLFGDDTNVIYKKGDEPIRPDTGDKIITKDTPIAESPGRTKPSVSKLEPTSIDAITPSIAPRITPEETATELPAELPAYAPIETPKPLVSPIKTEQPAEIARPMPNIVTTRTPVSTPTPIPVPTPTPISTPTPTPVPTPTPTPSPVPMPKPTPVPAPTVPTTETPTRTTNPPEEQKRPVRYPFKSERNLNDVPKLERTSMVAWKQGLWYVILNTDTGELWYSETKPPWVRMVRGPGSAYKSFSATGNVPPYVINMGAMKVKISKSGLKFIRR